MTKGFKIRHSVILLYKVKYGMAPKLVSELFKIKSTHRLLRNFDFELPRFDTVAFGRYWLRYQGVGRTFLLVKGQ